MLIFPLPIVVTEDGDDPIRHKNIKPILTIVIPTGVSMMILNEQRQTPLLAPKSCLHS